MELMNIKPCKPTSKEHIVLHNGNRYTLNWNIIQQYYVVTCDNQWVVNLSDRKISKAKKFLIHYLNN